jgi:hypothetical protein
MRQLPSGALLAVDLEVRISEPAHDFPFAYTNHPFECNCALL